MQSTKLQMVVGGLVLFSAGTLLGGYVMWTQSTKSNPMRSGTNSRPSRPIFLTVDPDRDGDLPPTVPASSAVIDAGTKSAVIFGPEDVAPVAVVPAPMIIGTKSAPVFVPADVSMWSGPESQEAGKGASRLPSKSAPPNSSMRVPAVGNRKGKSAGMPTSSAKQPLPTRQAYGGDPFGE